MHDLGHTRSASRGSHLVQTPDAFVRGPLPAIRGGVAVVHVSPARGAGFAQYTAELEASGALDGTGSQRFVFVLSGEVTLDAGGREEILQAGGYAFVPEGADHRITAGAAARLAVIEKRYVPLAGESLPELIVGREETVDPAALAGDERIQLRALLPGDARHDFAVNTMTYQPGASLPMVECHVMEHGLLMLEGGGIYRLGDEWYSVAAGDFIWMAPLCPQWFGAIGRAPAKYLIYKDWNRHPPL